MKNVENKVVIRGRLVNVRDGENGDEILVIASRNHKDIFPRVHLKPGNQFICRPHSRVYVEGHLETISFKLDDEDEFWVNDQIIVGDTVRLEPTLCEDVFGAKGRFFAEPNTEIYLKGRIKNIEQEGDYFRYVIKIDDGNSIRVSMRKLERHPIISIGDTVGCVCTMRTPKKEYEDKIVYFEDINVSDLCVIKKATLE